MAEAQDNIDASSDIDIADVDDENSSSILYVNRFIPSVERDAVSSESKDSEEELLKALAHVDAEVTDADEVSVKTMGRLIKFINLRLSLKYYFSADLRSAIVKSMLNLYHTKDKVSIIFRIKALNILIVMLNKKWEKLQLTLKWQPFWNELMSLVMRENRHELVSTDSIMVQHVNKLSSFLSKARPYYDIMDDNQFSDVHGDVYVKASASLQDLRMPTCIEGPLLLMSCLPTKWDHYDEMLPRWFDLWSTINQNHTWDLCWAIILARAVKHSKTFDWKPYVPFLLHKVKELLHLPSAENRRDSSYTSFPRTFPSHYTFFYDYIKETHQVLLNKLSKILVKVMMKDSSSVAVETSTITMPSIIHDVLEKQSLHVIGYNTKGDMVNDTAKLLVEFLHMLRGFVHASNTGSYVPWISAFFSIVLRTCGRLLGEALADRLSDQPASVWLAGQHSALFLSGYMLSLSLDGIYNKNLRVSRAFAMCLKHIISLQPQVIHIVCSFFLEALQPKAAHQPQQTTVALMSLSICVRQGMFPQPHLLNYIPEILRLSVSFLEASDSSKTVMVLDVLATIFGWLPVSNSFKLKIPRFTSYLQLLQHKEHDEQSFATTSSVYQAEYEAIVSYVTSDWAMLIFEKLFVLIDSEEVKVKGAKESAISSSISYFVAMYFQSLEDIDVSLEQSLEKMLIQYVLTRAPAHTDKTCGKIMEYYIGIRPQRLNTVLAALLTADFKAARMSADKLAFRLRIIGALFRQSQGTSISPDNRDAFATLLTDTAFVCHEEAKVRKHVGKVYKDLLKGCLSAYPVRVYARFQHNETIGAPNLVHEGDIQWFIPTAESMYAGVQHLQQLTSFCLTQIHSSLDIALTSKDNTATAGDSTSNTSNNSTTQFKKCEEMVGSSLALLRRLIRGSAEVLTDDFSAADWQKINVDTGRNTYLATLPAADATFVKEFRVKILRELASIHEKLEKTVAIDVFSGLRNNEFIAKQWMKVFHLIVTRRVGFCKDVDKYRKGIEMQTATQRIALCAAVYSRLKEHRSNAHIISNSGINNDATIGALTDAKKTLLDTLKSGYYWKRHDWNSNSLVSYIWIQHCARSLLFATGCNRLLFREDAEADPVFTCLSYLLDLTRHAYDEIRPQARKVFEKMAKMLGPKLNDAIASLLAVLRQPQATYYETASTLVTLKQATMMRRIQSDVTLKMTFLECLTFVQAIATSIEEMDKREKIMLSLADCFVKYTSGWSVTSKDLVVLQSHMMQPLLDGFNGTHNNATNTAATTTAMDTDDENSPTAVVAATTTTTAGRSGGLRLDTFNAYSLLHLLSSSALSRDQSSMIKPLLQFVQRQLTTCHGQPTQLVANTMLYRIVEIVAHKPSSEVVGQEWFDYWQQCWNPLHNASHWSGAMLGFVRILGLFTNTAEEGKTLWSRGVDEVLQAISFLSFVKPRTFAKRRTDQNNYSKYFSYGFAGTFWTMMTLNIVPIFNNPLGAKPSEVIEKIFYHHLVEVATHTGENEKRVVNDIRAEIFGAILRLFVTHRAHFVAQDDVNATSALLARYLKEQTDISSSEFMRDWQEALYFAWENVTHADMMFVLQGEILQSILANFRTSLANNTNLATVNVATTADDANNTTTTTGDEGFSKMDKTIMFVNASLLALSVAELLQQQQQQQQQQPGAETESLQMARMVAEIVTAPESNIVLPYRTSRSELSLTIAMLVDVTGGQVDLAAVYSKILQSATTSSSNAENSSSAMDVVTSSASSSSEDTSATTNNNNGSTNTDSISAAAIYRQNAVETATLLISRYWHRLNLRTSMPLILQLLPVLLQGVTDTRIDTVKLATDSLIGVLFALRPATAVDPASIYQLPLTLMKDYAAVHSTTATAATDSSTTTTTNSSNSGAWRVREVAIRGTIMLLTNSWLVLTSAQRLQVKDILVEGLKDAHVDVQKMAKLGMVAYLSWKTDSELQKIAEVYTRNSETLAAREKQKRRQQKAAAAAAASAADPAASAAVANNKADAAYLNTVHMMSCVILSRPYDLPMYLPPLLASFLRHSYYDVTKTILLATVQLFQRTHQDRWEEFQKKFSPEQLEDLQGAGAAHYFA